uniref:head GIN domain-containing protein n=1 Tax=uncultured Draconibacterium sp. TaxID=1573823 RepID=UPI003216E94E
MKTIKLFFVSSVALLMGATSCVKDTIDGNGIVTSEGRIANSFDKVKSSGDFEVHITSGDSHEVIVSAEENVIPYIETRVYNGTLNIDTDNLTRIKNTLPMEVFITTPELEGIKLSGSGIITTDYFTCDNMDILLSGSGRIITACNADEVEALVSGSGSVTISGVTNDADFAISGSGEIDAIDLSSIDCHTATSGSGDMWISVDHHLKAHISGSGNVFYYGQPEVETAISGSGNVINNN